MATTIDNSKNNFLYLCGVVQHYNNVCKIGNDFAKEIGFQVNKEVQDSLKLEEIPTIYEKMMEKVQAFALQIFDATLKVSNGTLKISVDKVKKIKKLQDEIDHEALAIKKLGSSTLLSHPDAMIMGISYGLGGFIFQILISNNQGNSELLCDQISGLERVLKPMLDDHKK